MKFKKTKNNMYLINNEFEISEELILKYDILLMDEINAELKEKLISENNFFIGYNMALKYLSRKMRSVSEVKKHLYDKEIYDEKIIEKLIRDKYLDDKEYAKAFINDKIHLSSDGPFKIRRELLENQIDEEIIESEITRFDKEIEIEKIRKIIDKKNKSNRNKSSNLLKMKIFNDLMNMGYTKEYINKVIEEFVFDNPEILEKQKAKIVNKLSKKYSGEELEYRVKAELYKQGFRQ